MSLSTKNSIPTKSIVAILCLLIYLGIVFQNAWLGDDPFITMRTVDNFVIHLKPDWNLGQRVQTFTHPLWFMLLSIIYFFRQDAYFSLFALSFLFSILTAFLLLFRLAPNTPMVIISFALLISSKSFIDYSTSGLENPLSHFLTIAYLIVLFKQKLSSERKVLLLSLFSCLAALNRLDTFLIFLPSLVYTISMAELNTKKIVKLLFLGYSPLLLWLLFSILYYGFPFPNTFYAKVHTGIPAYLSLTQGVAYLKNSFSGDPITLITIAASAVIIHSAKGNRQRAFSLGIFLYLLYVFWIGGDFMSGRFFSISFLASVSLLSVASNSESVFSFREKWVVMALIVIFSISLSNSHSPILFALDKDSPGIESANGITDQKTFYYGRLGLQNILAGGRQHSYVQEGENAKRLDESPITMGAIGIRGFFAGPEIFILDHYTLADPLRARLPVYDLNSRIGHFYRSYPAGYLDAIRFDDARLIEDNNLREFYSKLAVINSGDMFTAERMLTIIEMNFGKYDYLLDEYSRVQQEAQ